MYMLALINPSQTIYFLPSFSYDHEGRLTNVTRPTGVVTSLHREMEKSITIDIENSNRDDDVTVITNLSSVEASYTVVQGTETYFSACLCNLSDVHVSSKLLESFLLFAEKQCQNANVGDTQPLCSS